jgi:hypothetical protein
METRFAGFTNEEIQTLWEGLVFDDGIRYGQEPGSVEERLVRELEEESRAPKRLSENAAAS